MIKENEVQILLAEDNPGDAELAIRALKKSKMANSIIHVEDGLQAVKFLFGEGQYASRDVDNKPKVILLDVKMPKLTGIEVLQKIKSDERTKRIPVVMLTSSKEDPDMRTCFDLGASSYIVKPVEFEQFIKVVTTIGMHWLLVNNTTH